MNSTSELGKRRRAASILPLRSVGRAAAVAATAAVLGGCGLQGPWDYSPEEEPLYRGLYVSGVVLAGEPIGKICLERVLGLEEYAAQAFPWAGEAEMTVAGDFGTGEESIDLTPSLLRPACFEGPVEKVIRAGERYRLEGKVKWDSAGHPTETEFTAVARVPALFRLSDTVRVAASALRPPADDSSSGGNPLSFLNDLPPEVYAGLVAEFPGLDSALVDPVYGRKWFAQYGPRFFETSGELLLKYEKRVTYRMGDTVTYLTGNLNMASHYLRSDRSDDVDGVLISQVLPSDPVWPANNFSEMLGLEPEPARSYNGARVRQLNFVPKASSSDGSGFQIFDSIPVINLYFHEGVNTFKMYGMEKAYGDYKLTSMNAMMDSRIKISYNVEGIRGIFAGGVPDTFRVTVRIPKKNAFHNFEAHADYCSKTGWIDSRDCRRFEPVYCERTGYDDSVWIAENKEIMSGKYKSYNNCFEEEFRLGFSDPDREAAAAKRLSRSSLGSKEREGVRKEGLERGCLTTFFGRTAGDSARCVGVFDKYFRSESLLSREESPLYIRCEDGEWREEECLSVARLYCREGVILSGPLCGAAERWCRERPDDRLCR